MIGETPCGNGHGCYSDRIYKTYMWGYMGWTAKQLGRLKYPVLCLALLFTGVAGGSVETANIDLHGSSAGRPHQKQAGEKSFVTDHRAARKIMKMSPKEICSLPADDRIALINGMTVHDKEDLEAFKKLYRYTPLDADFAYWDAKKRLALAQAIAKDPVAQEALYMWDIYTIEEKKKTLHHISNILIQTYGGELGMKNVAGVEEYTINPSDYDYERLGEYRHDLNKIFLDFRKPEMRLSFEFAAVKILHETSHAFQLRLVDLYRAGKIKPGSPLYDQARLFSASYTYNSYINIGTPLGGIRLNLIEKHALQVQELAENYTNKGLESGVTATQAYLRDVEAKYFSCQKQKRCACAITTNFTPEELRQLKLH